MSKSTLAKVWTTLALAAVYCGFNGIADVQRSQFLLPFILEVGEGRGTAAKTIFWFLLVAIPYLLALYTAAAYNREFPSSARLERWPVMFDLDIDAKKPLGHRYQLFWIVLVMSVPMYSGLFLLKEMSELHVFKKWTVGDTYEGWKAHLTTFKMDTSYAAYKGEDLDRLLRETRKEDMPADGMAFYRRIAVSYYPGWQMWIFLGIFGTIVGLWIRVLVGVVRR